MLPQSLARALAIAAKPFKAIKRQTQHEDGTRSFHCSSCGAGPMGKDAKYCSSSSGTCPLSIEYHKRKRLNEDGTEKVDGQEEDEEHYAKKRRSTRGEASEAKAAESASSAAQPAASAALSGPPAPPAVSSRARANALGSAQATLKSMHSLVDAAVSARLPQCDACHLDFESERRPGALTDRLPRALPCGHSCCTSCAQARFVSNTRTLPCPTCETSHVLPPAAGSSSSSAADPEVPLPLNQALLSSLRASGTFLPALREFATSVERMCAAATAVVTATSSSGAESPVLAADELSQLELEVALHDQKTRQKDDLRRRRAEQIRKRAEAEAAAAEEAARSAAAAAAAAASAQEKAAATAAAAAAAAAAVSSSASSNKKSSRDTPAAATDSSSDTEMPRAPSITPPPTASPQRPLPLAASAPKITPKAHHAAAAAAAALPPPSSLSVSTWGEDMARSPICRLLTIEQRSRLQTWLGVDINLRKARLVYQGTRDGWMPNDMFDRCSNRGPTLLLVKVSGSDHVFGAFAVVPWFRPPTSSTATGSKLFSNVLDRAYRSFLFSLRNDAGFPFRMTLHASHGPATVAHPTLGPMFGGRARAPDGSNSQFPNIALCCEGRPGNSHDSNVINDPIASNCSYQFEEETRHAPPPGFACDPETLAGRHAFAMEEMEVYSINVPGFAGGK